MAPPFDVKHFTSKLIFCKVNFLKKVWSCRIVVALLYRLSNHISHGIRCLPHHVRRGVGVGTEGESRAVMPQGVGQSLHIYSVLQRQRCEGMPEIMEPDMLGADGFQDLLVGVPEGVRIEHSSRLGRREHVGISRVLLVLLHQQLHCLL